MVSLWRKYINAPKKKKQALHSLCVGFAFFVFLFAITKIFAVSLCPVYNIFDVECPGCGMTRGFISIMQLNFQKAIEYNVLSIPLFFGISVYCIMCFTDIIFEKDHLERIEKQLTRKYMYFIYFIIIAVAMILNRMI